MFLAGLAPALHGEGAAPVDAEPCAGAALHPLLERPARLHVGVQLLRLEHLPALSARRKKKVVACACQKKKVRVKGTFTNIAWSCIVVCCFFLLLQILIFFL
jgi:hypothetical protein